MPQVAAKRAAIAALLLAPELAEPSKDKDTESKGREDKPGNIPAHRPALDTAAAVAVAVRPPDRLPVPDGPSPAASPAPL